MLRSPVFLDSSALNDLRELLSEGVQRSDTVVLLATKGVLQRPWCLLELLEASRRGTPIVVVQMSNAGFTFAEARSFAVNLEEHMEKWNASGLKLLRQHVGVDLSKLRDAVLRLLDTNEHCPLYFNTHAGDSAMVAMMKDIVERMAEATGQSLTWSGGDTANLLRQRTESSLRRSDRSDPAPLEKQGPGSFGEAG
eukprot:2298738-Prymnesium_polylepis.2